MQVRQNHVRNAQAKIAGSDGALPPAPAFAERDLTGMAEREDTSRPGSGMSNMEFDRAECDPNEREEQIIRHRHSLFVSQPITRLHYLACAVAPAGLVWNDDGAASAMVPVPWPCPDSALK